MKLDILIVDIALLALIFSPYFLIIFLNRAEGKSLKKRFLNQASLYNLKIVECDTWNSNIIGLDKGKAKILFVQKRKTGFVTEIIDLKQVRTSCILQNTQSVKINKHVSNILQKIDLQLVLHNGSLQNINLYNCEETYSQDYEIKNAERWNRIINESLTHSPTVNSAA